jgi:hypothetical protein
MQTSLRQPELLAEAAADLSRIDEKARGLIDGLSEAQLRWSPPDGGWSIAQVFEHLATSNGSYLAPTRVAIEKGPRRDGGGEEWKPSFFGGLLYRMLQPSNPRRSPSPRGWRPESTATPAAIDQFFTTQATLAELIRAAQPVDLLRTRLSSPANRLVRLNLGDVFRVLVVHEWRHLGQIERVLARPGFPPHRSS